MNNATLDRKRHDKLKLLAELTAAGTDVTNPKAICCPFHEDKHPSAGVYEDAGGVWRFQCHTSGCEFGGDYLDVRSRFENRPIPDVVRDEVDRESLCPPSSSQLRSADATYPTINAMRAAVNHCDSVYVYSLPETRSPEMIVLRIEEPGKGKRFLQARPAAGGFVMRAPPKPWPIYNRTRVLNANRVVVVEGEQCVHALQKVGLVATTSPGGAGKAASADWSPLAGRTAFLWPDADPPDPKTGQRSGIRHMRQVATILASLNPPCRVMWIDCDDLGLPAKGDVVDFLDAMAGESTESKRESIECVLRDACSLGVAAEVKGIFSDIVTGKRRAISWPWPTFTRMTRALLPGTVTCICGAGGATKSFFLLEAAAYWFEQGVHVALYELEDGRAYHARRVLAQRAGCGDLFDDDWIAANPERASELLDEHAGFLDRFGACIHEASNEDPKLPEIVEWAQRVASAGARVIAIDPISAADVSDKRWIDDQNFILDLKRCAAEFEVAVLLITHPRTGSKGRAMLDNVSGGAAFTRFSHVVCWLEALDEPQEMSVRVLTPLGNFTELRRANRVMRLLKTRNAAGTGHSIAFDFGGRNLRFEELGLVLRNQ